MRKYVRILFVNLLLISIFLVGCASTNSTNKNSAENYPDRQIELVVPFAAGGGVDLTARAVADYISKEWGQPIVVVNKTGGGGIVGAQYALKEAKADGYTVLMNNNSSTTMYEAGTTNPVLTTKDHKLAARVAESPLVYAVRADAPWDNLKDFSNWVKENPAELTWASVGPAGFSSFGVAEWLDYIGVDYKQTKMVSSEGASDSGAKVAGGHVILAVHNAGEVYSLVEAGKLKVLAVQGNERSPLYPDVPTTEELGFDGLTVKWWTGISLPKDTPDEIVRKWDKTIAKMQDDAEFINQLEKIFLQPAYLNATDFAEEVEAETDWYMTLGENTGIRK
ncbi:tripartite tricarboxylate transporter substrate binding protein [Caldibacillus lycopersici]|uniref:Tripartite tricarboxylate transporter substrate binding protein n=1 Tax=Perspicuibacillus lycopersici TaxID=1325689 RepID=A0AAE3IZ82_9BACI|nr:tripartite tricarboxylate transporter substrate binding protein [Perspicuibacillus lycopersici]MCU9614775.1 tripartite tricarboxylate transporter substrate binding protein [Perspicuibacillus lycopersici]